MTEPILSPTQQAAVDKIVAMQSGVAFLTGEAGTGKSTVVRAVKAQRTCVLLAPTGIAAINIGGQTVHSFFKIGGCVTKRKCNAVDALRHCMPGRMPLIVIDEAGMNRADLLDGINWCLQATMRSTEPFGGFPVLLVGDPCQLEPVVTSEEKDFMKKYRSPFFFDAMVFDPSSLYDEDRAQIETIALTEVYRQADPAMLDNLNLVRRGDAGGLAFFNQRVEHAPDDVVRLTFTRNGAESRNAMMLDRLGHELQTYEAVCDEVPEKDAPAPLTLHLAVGARVMVCKNILADDGSMLANGSVGTVSCFHGGKPIVRFDDGRISKVAEASWDRKAYVYDAEKDDVEESVVGTFTQIPLKLAWAVTVHKAQGQTLARAMIDAPRSAFAHGQTYVALSRVKSIEGLYLSRSLTRKDLVFNERVAEWMEWPIPGQFALEAA